jgi:hypothetical protein
MSLGVPTAQRINKMNAIEIAHVVTIEFVSGRPNISVKL